VRVAIESHGGALKDQMQMLLVAYVAVMRERDAF